MSAIIQRTVYREENRCCIVCGAVVRSKTFMIVEDSSGAIVRYLDPNDFVCIRCTTNKKEAAASKDVVDITKLVVVETKGMEVKNPEFAEGVKRNADIFPNTVSVKKPKNQYGK